MWARIVRSLGVLVALALITGSALAASSAWKQYTFAAAPPSKVVAPGTMAVRFPAGWVVSTTWPTLLVRNGTPHAYPLSSKDADWWVDVSLEAKGTTMSDVRSRMLGWAGKSVWGEGTPMRAYVGDSNLTLPMGKVWRLTLALVPVKGETGFGVHYERDYVLDRGVVTTAQGAQRHLFNMFTVTCSAEFCKTHNGQLAAIMRSIRITP